MNIVDSQARDLAVITPSNVAGISPSPISIYVGGTGNLTVITEAQYEKARIRVATGLNSTDAQIMTEAQAANPTVLTTLISACPVGFVLNARIRAVLSTGTTATLLVGYLA